eukprot:Tbor_TRINITY_DN5786_c0_g2::TRINITY_DN5786_c0_g2_i2::g.20942::m.20942/K03349/APC2; anaphase-promoting complex subunit 2
MGSVELYIVVEALLKETSKNGVLYSLHNTDWVSIKRAAMAAENCPEKLMLMVWINDEVCKMFSSSCLADFTTILLNNPMITIEAPTVVSRSFIALRDSFLHTVDFLQRWCDVVGFSSHESIRKMKEVVRCGLLHSNLFSGSSENYQNYFLQFLSSHASSTIRALERKESPDALEGVQSPSVREMDAVFHSLHTMGLSDSKDARARMEETIQKFISDKIVCFMNSGAIDENTAVLPSLLEWQENVATHFLQMANGFISQEESAQQLERISQFTMRTLSERYVESFWNLIVDFPCSKPSLEDLRECIYHLPDGVLTTKLISVTRRILSSKLHHAGAQTEDIMTVLVNVIRTLCYVIPRKDQGTAVSSVIGDTLGHFKSRSDCVSVITKGLTSPDINDNLFEEFQSYGGNCGSDDDIFDEGGTVGRAGGRSTGWQGGSHSSKYRQCVNVLRVLLSVVNVDAIVVHYSTILANSLLKDGCGDLSQSEEVVERLKFIVGEDSLSNCSVMLRDLQMSRRTTARLAELSPVLRSPPTFVSIITHTRWPSLDGDTAIPPFNLHNSISCAAEAYAREFHAFKPNQRLRYMLSHGIISLKVTQKDPKTYCDVISAVDLNPFVATALLHLVEAGDKVSVKSLCEKMNVNASGEADENGILKILQPYHSLLVLDWIRRTVGFQKMVVTKSNFVEDEQEEENSLPTGMPPAEIEKLKLLVKAMLKSVKGDGKAVNTVYNSLKMVGAFNGSQAELEEVLVYLIDTGFLVSVGGKYKLAPTT